MPPGLRRETPGSGHPICAALRAGAAGGRAERTQELSRPSHPALGCACRFVLGEDPPFCRPHAPHPPCALLSVLPPCLARNLGGEEPKVVRGGSEPLIKRSAGVRRGSVMGGVSLEARTQQTSLEAPISEPGHLPPHLPQPCPSLLPAGQSRGPCPAAPQHLGHVPSLCPPNFLPDQACTSGLPSASISTTLCPEPLTTHPSTWPAPCAQFTPLFLNLGCVPGE